MRRILLVSLLSLILLMSLGAVGFVLNRQKVNSKNKDTENTQQNDSSQQEMSETQKSKPMEFTFGGRELMPKHRFVALYGNPNFKALGSLGEQGLTESVSRIKQLAAEYQPHSEEEIIPVFEIIATIASADVTENNDYSQELSIETIKPWIELAEQEGVYVVLDLQPGRSTFNEQIKQYEELLKHPNVGIALDPEWRLLTPEARHLKKIGSVSAEEINRTSMWLAELVKKHDLPPKIFMIHQFKQSMITNRETLDTSREELAYVIHMDGHGELGSKINSWNVVKESLPQNIYLGWKNFIDEDKPTPTPEQTMSQDPKPWFISFQ